ncbi:hypothetical protein M8J77_019004 [Diaphorina citri]|nr:hypothetical protein M8J77_019004 [Diaphorina citri]
MLIPAEAQFTVQDLSILNGLIAASPLTLHNSYVTVRTCKQTSNHHNHSVNSIPLAFSDNMSWGCIINEVFDNEQTEVDVKEDNILETVLTLRCYTDKRHAAVKLQSNNVVCSKTIS